MSNYKFGHEKLKVYQKALDFVEWVDDLIKTTGIRNNTIDHLIDQRILLCLILHKETEGIPVKINVNIMIFHAAVLLNLLLVWMF